MKKAFLFLILIVFLCSSVAYAQVTKTLRFAWNQELSADFGGWRIYQADTAGGPYTALSPDILFVSEQTEYTADMPIEVPDDQTITLYFVLTAFDTSGNESGYSNEVSATIDFEAPGMPMTLTVTVVAQ